VPAAAGQRVRGGSLASQTVPTHGIAGSTGAGQQRSNALAVHCVRSAMRSRTWAAIPPVEGPCVGVLGFFWSLTLSQACPGPTAVLIDELDAGGF
jgi:hypothetical protein